MMDIVVALFLCYLLWLLWVKSSKKQFTVRGGNFPHHDSTIHVELQNPRSTTFDPRSSSLGVCIARGTNATKPLKTTISPWNWFSLSWKLVPFSVPFAKFKHYQAQIIPSIAAQPLLRYSSQFTTYRSRRNIFRNRAWIVQVFIEPILAWPVSGHDLPGPALLRLIKCGNKSLAVHIAWPHKKQKKRLLWVVTRTACTELGCSTKIYWTIEHTKVTKERWKKASKRKVHSRQ